MVYTSILFLYEKAFQIQLMEQSRPIIKQSIE